MMRCISLCVFLVVLSVGVYGQGQITDAASPTTNPMNPDGNGFITSTDANFTRAYDVAEFELPMVPIPITQSETINDSDQFSVQLTGYIFGFPVSYTRELDGNCTWADLVPDSLGASAYIYKDASDNIITRFRVADDEQADGSGGFPTPGVNVFYSLWIDSDSKIGGNDPNSNSENPGFEYMVVFNPDEGIFIYNIDGDSDCADELANYSVNSNHQQARANTNNCSTPDYFMDFYFPASGITGLDLDADLRFVASATVYYNGSTCPLDADNLDNTDINGIEESDPSDIIELVGEQCASSINNINSGFADGLTETPFLDQVFVGDDEVGGTAQNGSDLYIDVYDASKNLVEQDTTTTIGSGGSWASNTFSRAFQNGDSIIVFASITDQCLSEVDENGSNYRNISDNPIPSINDVTLSITYTENGDPIDLFSNLQISDDGNTLTTAEITIFQNYLSAEDTLIVLGSTTGFTVSWDDVAGKLTITGDQSIDDYEELLSSVQYKNTATTLTSSIRRFALRVKDDAKFSPSYSKDIVLISENDAPHFINSNSVRIDTFRLYLTQDTEFTYSTGVYDEEGDDYKITVGNLVNGKGKVSVDSTDQTKFRFVPDSAFVGNDFFNWTVCDANDSDNCSSAAVILNVVEPNEPANITAPASRGDGDTIQFAVYPNGTLSTCLSYSDPNNDKTTLESWSTVTGGDTISISLESGNFICFNYTAGSSLTTTLYQFELCDDGLPDPVCKTYFVEIFTVDQNSAPFFVYGGETIDTLSYTVGESTALTDTVTLTDSQGDNSILEDFDDVLPEISGGQLIFTVAPPELFFGEYDANITVCDDNDSIQCRTLRIILDVSPFNAPPIAGTDNVNITSTDAVPIAVLENDEDPEGEGIILDTTFALNAGHGTMYYEDESTIMYVPDRYYDGPDEFLYTLCDLGVPQECITGQVSILIDIPTEDLVVYQAFSPNGDMINDEWIIDGIGEYPDNAVRVFDQWNREVFSATGYDNENVVWTGQDNDGQDLPEGSYIYNISFNNGPATRSGMVILKR